MMPKKMTLEDLEKVMEIEDFPKRSKKLKKVIEQVIKKELVLEIDAPSLIIDLANLAFQKGDLTTESLVTLYSLLLPEDQRRVVPKNPLISFNDMYVHAFEFLQENNVLEDREKLEYCEIGDLFIGNKSIVRGGMLLFTDKRMVLFGRKGSPAFHDNEVYRLTYDGWEERPEVNCFDYIRYDDIESVELKYGSSVIIKHRAKYLREKGTTLYGPLFFKFDLPKKVETRTGVLESEIRLMDLVKKDKHRYNKARCEEIVKLLRTKIHSSIEIE